MLFRSTKQKLGQAASEISKAETRTRAMNRALNKVEQIESDSAAKMLGLADDSDVGDITKVESEASKLF